MFGLTKNDSQNPIGTKNNTQPGSSPINNFNIADAPIHTMQDDLERIKNPNAIIADRPQATTAQKQGAGPFSIPKNEDSQSFNQLKNNSARAKIIDEESSRSFLKTSGKFDAANLFNASNSKDARSNLKAAANTQIDRRFMAFSALSVILLIALTAAGFHFFNNKSSPPEEEIIIPIEEPTQPIETPTGEPIPTPTPTFSFSENNPNYLRVENGTLIADKVRSTMGQVSQEGYVPPIEFIITDAQNKPIAFKSFSELFSIKLSSSVLESLGDNFSLFVFNDLTGPKIGIAVESKNDATLGKALTKEETVLADEINPLFFNNTYNKAKSFNNSEYGGAKIRYQNIISPEMLSIDYSIYKNKLLIGTTKLTIRAIIDRLNNISATRQTETIPPVTEKTTNN
ncbi:MAG: hypothetical protein WCO05_01670 [Candidatus Moraniibacteriota bacterium]